MTAVTNATFSQNTVFNLTNTNATAASVVTGIQFSGTGTANVVERNLIYGITAATNSTAAEVNGIRVGGGITAYRNNMIAVGAGIPNAIGTGSTTGGVNSIFETAGVTTFFHNSVYIGGAPTAGVGPSMLLTVPLPAIRAVSATILFTTRETTRARRAKITSSESANTGTFVSNYNIFVGTGATAANFFDYGTSATEIPVSFTAWQAGPPTRDANS